MTYSVELSKHARDFLKKADKQVSTRIVAVLERVRIRPEQYIVRLVGSPYYKIRAGDYRIIVDLQEKRLCIFAIKIGHRKNIYDGL